MVPHLQAEPFPQHTWQLTPSLPPAPHLAQQAVQVDEVGQVLSTAQRHAGLAEVAAAHQRVEPAAVHLAALSAGVAQARLHSMAESGC